MPTISAVPGLPTLGWDDRWASALADLGDPDLRPARVSRVDRGICTVLTGTTKLRVGTPRGVEVAVGDWVGVGLDRPTGSGATIVAVLPRRGSFQRTNSRKGGTPQTVAANIDTLLLCDALDGSLGLRHLERFLALAWQSGATPVVLITKSDTMPAAQVREAVAAVSAAARGVGVVVISSTTGAGLEDLATYLVPRRTVALVGLSGAGKSTLANLLVGMDVLATGAVRKDGTGRHTTTHRELVVLPGGGLLIDTPGMRALSALGASDGVERTFDDIESLAGGCRYPNCTHSGEEGCAVIAAVADGTLEARRLESWRQLKPQPAASEIQTARQDVQARKHRKKVKVANRRAARAAASPLEPGDG